MNVPPGCIQPINAESVGLSPIVRTGGSPMSGGRDLQS